MPGSWLLPAAAIFPVLVKAPGFPSHPEEQTLVLQLQAAAKSNLETLFKEGLRGWVLKDA